MKNAQNPDEDISMDHEAEEISENLYLSAYFHCDKGSGVAVEDITEHNTEATITFFNPSPSPESDERNDDLIWTNVLEEFEPLEYEDKWGRKSPGAHAIKFQSNYIITFFYI
jgi:hypothetical protein